MQVIYFFMFFDSPFSSKKKIVRYGFSE